MTEFEKTPLNRVKRVPDRGAYDAETVYEILDAGLVCHVGLVQDNQPIVIPTLYARQDDSILLHGATTSRLIQYAASGKPLGITVTHIDGIVLARSVFHHSMNYRSVVVFGSGHLVDDMDEKTEAMRLFTEHIMPGRWDDVRQPNGVEMKATSIVAVPIDSASAKIRTGGPKDEDEDYALPIWAGVLPLTTEVGKPIADDVLPPTITLPTYISEYDK